MSDLYPATEDDYYARAEGLGAARDHADRVLRQALDDGGAGNPYELAYLQLAADLNRNPK
ncbi:hypothetical protein ACIGNX_02515 [Actinosynnema sp. NPDC053489]|uniref:hypothetical protein n=1 Tax=Actinosynnema sp. NPDC053489 TaxID=3363916 RepID=UPI0037C54A5D